MSQINLDNAELMEIGQLKESENWTNIYLKFNSPELAKPIWLYYSEHVDKPPGLKQIKNFVNGTFKLGDIMDVRYRIRQALNKSTVLSIVYIANHRSKK